MQEIITAQKAHVLVRVGQDQDAEDDGHTVLIELSQGQLTLMLDYMRRLSDKDDVLCEQLDAVELTTPFKSWIFRQPKPADLDGPLKPAPQDDGLPATCRQALLRQFQDQVYRVQDNAARWLKEQEVLHQEPGPQKALRAHVGAWSVQFFPSHSSIREMRTAYLDTLDLLELAVSVTSISQAAEYWRELYEMSPRSGLQVLLGEESNVLGTPNPDRRQALRRQICPDWGNWLEEAEVLIQPDIPATLRATALERTDPPQTQSLLLDLIEQRPLDAVKVLDHLPQSVVGELARTDLTPLLQQEDPDIRHRALRVLTRVQ